MDRVAMLVIHMRGQRRPGALASIRTAAIDVGRPLVARMGLEPLARRVFRRPIISPVAHTAEALARISSSLGAAPLSDIHANDLGGIDGVAPLVAPLLSHGEIDTAEQLISVLV